MTGGALFQLITMGAQDMYLTEGSRYYFSNCTNDTRVINMTNEPICLEFIEPPRLDFDKLEFYYKEEVLDFSEIIIRI